AAAAEIAARRNLAIAIDRIWRKEPVPFVPRIVAAVERAATDLGYPHRRMVSGAGHDACNLAAAVPTAMIFVPCRDGVSHNESESASEADCAAGAQVLLHTLLALANAPGPEAEARG
ncbi:M20/M25/M40 family metallo-hydrolase, partial [Methylobacterium sp. A54F]